jgi:CelD/BcsL family acetyltransferase involved in cellulose biosynthesis
VSTLPEIVKVSAATPDQWDDVWNRCPYATFFHSREWAEAWERYTQGRMRPEPWLIEFADGMHALLPLSAVRRRWPLTTRYVSSPAGTFGGWISDQDLQEGHAAAILELARARAPSLELRLNPYGPQPAGGLRSSRQEYTSSVALAPGFAQVVSGWSTSHARSARKGLREGVTVRLAETEDDWRLYYSIYLDSLRRWGARATSRYRWELFESLFAARSPRVRLWLAQVRGAVAAGALCLYARENVVYWHGAALERWFHVRPVHVLFSSVIEDACGRGYRFLDFNPSAGHAGVEAFKNGFGPARLACPVVSQESRGARFLLAVLRLLR